MNTMHVLCSTGDIQVTWDSNDSASVANARSEVESLKDQGYSFFLVDGSPADAVQAAMANGTLVCRRISAEEVVGHLGKVTIQRGPDSYDPDNPRPDLTLEPNIEPEPTAKKRRGRPAKAKTVVATRQLSGG